jgi:hypothetical protein
MRAKEIQKKILRRKVGELFQEQIKRTCIVKRKKAYNMKTEET